MAFVGVSAGTIAGTVGAIGSVASGVMGAMGASSAGGASRAMINRGVGFSAQEAQNSDKMIGAYLNPWAWGGYDMFRQARDELNNGSMTPYNWERYVQEQGLAPGTSQQQYLKEYRPEDFGKDIGQTGWSLADLYKSMTPEDFQKTYGYDLAKSGIEYDPARFKQEVGYDLANAGKEYDANRFRDQYGYNLDDALKEFRGDNLQDTPGYQFRLNQGLQANDRLAAARGGVLGGGQLKAQERYAQDYAANEFQAAYERDAQRKAAALGQYNQAYQSDMANRQGMLEAYGQRYGQDLANRQTMLGQWNTAYANNQADLARKQGLYFGTRDYKNLINQQQLANYQQNFDNTGKWQLQRQTFLSDLAKMGLSAANSAAQLKQANTGLRIGAYTGGASANAQNAWNQAGAMNSSMSNMAGNLAGLAGMWMGSRNGNNNNWNQLS